MAFSEKVVEELTEKLRVYEADKAKIDRKIAAIKELMADQVTSAPSPRQGKASEDTAAAQNNALRGMLRDLLRQSPAGLKTKEIVRQLKGQGYAPNGTTNISSKVSGEIYRLKKKGEVTTGTDRKHKWVKDL